MKNKKQSRREKLIVFNVLLAVALIGSVAFVIYSKNQNREKLVAEPPKENPISQNLAAEKTNVAAGTEEDVPQEKISEKEKAKKVNFQIISFKNGLNEIDLNSDGIQDMVVKSFRNNGTSPHSYNVYDFFINKPASQYEAKVWVIVQIDKEKNDKDAINIEYDNDVSTSEGAEVVLKDIRIIKANNKYADVNEAMDKELNSAVGSVL